jgi:murein DD-endopeptidase MepM/ murein hydrolase activator NlpD
MGDTSRMTELATEVQDARIVDFPLRGEWRAVHTPGSRIPSHGTDMLGQRYAYDLIRFDPERGSRYYPVGTARMLLTGVPTRDCHGWGEPIHAPLDGEVVVARDDQPERERIHPIGELLRVLKTAVTFRPTPEAVTKLLGNHVILRCDDVYAAFAHMTPGSVAVHDGDHVRVGDLLGRVGHSGNSTAPHLHFQLMDSIDPLVAKGVPCAFRAYEVEEDGRWRTVTNAIPRAEDRIRSLSSDDRSDDPAA